MFQTFWMGGYEGADHTNGHGEPLDPSRRNGHMERLADDYAAAWLHGMGVVRETVGWRLLHERGSDGLHGLRQQATLAAKQGMQVLWSLMHYGWPGGLDPFTRPEEFIEAFAEHCQRVARVIHGIAGSSAVYQPINEISFLAWAASSTGLIHPHVPSAPGRGNELKRVLVRAAIRSMDAIRGVDPSARFVHTDPLIHVEPPLGAGPEACTRAHHERDVQFEAWDMLAGRCAPELGGAEHYLDVLGLNYYHDNQWEHGTGQRLHWHQQDRRRRPFSTLAAAVWDRFGRPMCVSETGHVGEGRAAWFDYVASEVALSMSRGVDIVGLCLYPLVDRTDWQNLDHWHHSGLWDVPGADRGDFTRVLCEPLARRLAHWQLRLARSAAETGTRIAQRPPHAALSELQRLDNSTPSQRPTMNHLIVFSHLRWDFVYQRPQHVLSRLAATNLVLFVEEPVTGAPHPSLEVYKPCAGVTVLRMHVPGRNGGFHDEHVSEMRALLQHYLSAQGIDDYLLWFYTPMALPLAEGLVPRAMVYDCMDELAAFDFAPAELIAREDALFRQVDLVFTGGRSLYESKRMRHTDVHCFPSSVDHAHFGQQNVPDHPAQAALARPRLGYYGVIDERIDLDLVAALADCHPEWEVVMVGPLAKVDPTHLPQRRNLHWMGKRQYDELPAFLAGWDVCLMPFALNASTRFISPTKTLEYLAAGKPVVSTPVRDVVAQYASVVPIAGSSAEFVASCEEILAWTCADRTRFAVAAADTVAGTSWDRTVKAMQSLLERVLTDASATTNAFVPDPELAPVV